MKSFAIALLGCVLVIAGDRALASSEAVEPRVITLEPDREQPLQLHVFGAAAQDGAAKPAILLLHGGGWRYGSASWMFDSARRFADAGMVAISVEYRLARDELTPIEAYLDTCEALHWTRQQADKFGIDADRIAAYGVSAGGHLAALAATRGCEQGGGQLGNGGPDLLMLWSPAVDMENDGWFQKLLQGRAEAAEYSPLSQLDGSTPPVLIVQGEQDTLTPARGAKAYCEAVRAQDARCEMHLYPGVGHLLTRNLEQQERDFDPDPEMVREARGHLMEFLRKHGYVQDSEKS